MLSYLIRFLWVTIIHTNCSVFWYYDQREPNTIHICNSTPKSEQTFTIAHELWHLYMFTQMSASDRSKYKTENEIEWFADDFAKFVLKN